MPQVADDTRLYRGQGQVFLGKKVGGQPAGLEFIGNVSELMLNPQTEKIEHQESQTGYNSVDKVIERGLKVEMSMTTDSFTKENIARFVFGKITNTAITTVTLEPSTN
jgi:phosphoribosylformylglycinamidine (FGAM) synthase PurS component